MCMESWGMRYASFARAWVVGEAWTAVRRSGSAVRKERYGRTVGMVDRG